MDVAAMKRIQLDTRDLAGIRFKKHAEIHESSDPDVSLACQIMKAWDGNADRASKGYAVYILAIFKMIQALAAALTPDPKLQEESYLGGFDPILKGTSEFVGSMITNALNCLDNPDSWWTTRAGGKKKLLDIALKHAITWMREHRGKNPDEWTYANVVQMQYAHPMHTIPAMDYIFSVGPVDVGGGIHSPNCGWFIPGYPVAGVTYRQIIDMADLDNSCIIYGPGQSGNVASKHYADLVPLWAAGEYIPMLWRRDAVEKHAESRLLLKQ